MGAEESILRNYEVGSPYEVENIAHEASNVATKKSAGENEGSGPKLEFRVCPAFHKEDGSPISVLIFDKKKGCKSQHGINNAEVLRTVRHPFILKYIGLCESDRSIKLLTEDVFSLEYCIHDLEDFEIIAGLHNILEALIFMHEKGGLVHKNVYWSSVFVSKKDGSWKLGGMEKVEKLSSKGMDQDVNDYTKFAISLMDSVETCGYEQKKFVLRLQELNIKNQNAEAGNSSLDTGHLKSLLDEPVFKNSFLEISKFFNEITMKKESEKENFFRTLADKLRSLDHTVVAKKLLKRLFSKITLAEPSAEKYFIPELLAFGKGHGIDDFCPLFPDDIYRKYCVPLILNLMFCNETHVRLLLLKHMPLFVDAIDKETLQDEVLPEILLGIRDENDEIVSATLHGLACLVKILGGDVVIGGERSKLFKDQRPKFASGSPPDFNMLMPVSKSASSSPEPRHQTRESMQKRKEERKRQNELRRQLREKEKLKKTETVAVKQPSYNTQETSPHKESSTVSIECTSIAAMESEKIDADKSPKTEESDPDWEGFEAFSSESEVEEENDSKLAKSSRSAESLLMIAKDSLSMEQFDRKNVVETQPDIEPSTKAQSAETYQFQRIDSINSVNSATSKDSNSTHTSPVYKAEIKQSPTLTTRKTIPKSSKKLGEEFELQVSVNKTSEPDFFADMTPDLSKSSTVLIERNLPNVSSKFQVPEANSEVSSGWEDDGWDDFT